MVKNIVEKAITPYNPSSNKVLNKDKYNLFVPTADVNKPGMAGYNPAHFEVRNQIVSISSLYTAGIQKEIADAKSSLNARIDAETWKVKDITDYAGDMNDLFTPGSYLCRGDNVPEPTRFAVFVLDIKAAYVQYAISLQGQVYIRYGRFADKSWSSWEKLTFESTVDAVKGDIQTLSDKLNSIVIGNKQEIYTIVNTLPEEGLTDKIYLVPVIEPDTQNKFDEYLWVNGHWEYFGRSTVSIDTSNLVTKQNFLTGYGAPTSKTVSPFIGALYVDLSSGIDTYQCTEILSTGVDFQWVKLLNDINIEQVDLPVVSKQDFLVGDKAPTTSTVAPFIGALYVDTTNNNTYQCTAITSEGGTTTYTWVKLIRETDYARQGLSHGVVRIDSSYGVWLPNGSREPLAINRAIDDMIVGRSGIYRPLTGGHTDLIVSEGLGNCKNTSLWTEEVKANARALLGINTETWTFTLDDGSTVTKKVLVLPDTEA